ncbi:hypothetical protein KP509_11G046600 [Ceratopteris richardii]|uniref:Uncharacterized protein n=1 Tax=Ceratopteris richardii TaxID=49495 RepID=A0A8T2TUZ7_CERRI|nr:hypothetical protein KP509_11G046600 [Ceratopteris richardii]
MWKKLVVCHVHDKLLQRAAVLMWMFDPTLLSLHRMRCMSLHIMMHNGDLHVKVQDTFSRLRYQYVHPPLRCLHC